jgi:hypothetical protein
MQLTLGLLIGLVLGAALNSPMLRAQGLSMFDVDLNTQNEIFRQQTLDEVERSTPYLPPLPCDRERAR